MFIFCVRENVLIACVICHLPFPPFIVWRFVCKFFVRTIRCVTRVVRRTRMLRLNVSAVLPIPSQGDIVDGETAIEVPMSRRRGSFRVILQRISSVVLGPVGESNTEEEVIGNELVSAIESHVGTSNDLDTCVTPSRFSLLLATIAHMFSSVASFLPTVVSLFGGFMSLYTTYRRLCGDDELVVVRRSQMRNQK